MNNKTKTITVWAAHLAEPIVAVVPASRDTRSLTEPFALAYAMAPAFARGSLQDVARNLRLQLDAKPIDVVDAF